MLPTIDSIQLFIPISQIQITSRMNQTVNKPIKLVNVDLLDCRLQDSVISIYETTGEVISIKDHQPITVSDKGINTGYRLIRKTIGPSVVTGVSVALTAKLLKQDYIKGISQSTIKQVYNALIDQQVINLTFTDFIKSKVEMIDLKMDKQVVNPLDELQVIYERVKNRQTARKHSNGNVQIGQRQKANNTNIYIKFYNKFQELQTNSAEFYHFHKPLVQSNLIRTEITLHRKQLINLLGRDYNHSLEQLLYLIDQQGEQVMAEILDQHLHQIKTSILQPANESNLISKDEMLVKGIVDLMFQIDCYQTVEQFQDEVLRIVQPGINKQKRLKKLVKDYYLRRVFDEGLGQEELVK